MEGGRYTSDHYKIKLATTCIVILKIRDGKKRLTLLILSGGQTALSTSPAIVTHPQGKVALFPRRRDHIMAVILICPARVLARWSRRDVFEIGKNRGH